MHLGLSQRLESHLAQTLRQELRQELRLILQLILKLVQLLRLEERVTIENVAELRDAIRTLPYDDRATLAERVVRGASEQIAIDLAVVLRSVAFGDHDQRRNDLEEFAGLVDGYRKRIAQRIDHARGPALALRLILREPHCFGGRPGTPEELAALLNAVPQETESGSLAWVLGGGWAVELLCGEHVRDHHDIDTIVLTQKPVCLDTDVVHTDDYFGVITCTRRFFTARCVREIEVRQGGLIPYHGRVAVACPEFLLCSKLLRVPRDKDWMDVVALIRHFALTWDLDLIREIAKRNCCDFTRTNDLLRILRTRDPEHIIAALQGFRS